MQIGKVLNLWGLGVNFLLVVLFGAFRTQSYFPILAMIVIAALVVMPILATIRRVRFAKPELRILVSLYGTSMLWIPLFVNSLPIYLVTVSLAYLSMPAYMWGLRYSCFPQSGRDSQVLKAVTSYEQGSNLMGNACTSHARRWPSIAL